MDPAADAPQTDAVQPANGDQPGAESQGGLGDLYDLSSVPEELKPYAEDLLGKVNSNVERKFREHADYRKQWEPYEGIEGLSDVEPDDLKELLEFSQLASDPEKFEEWWTDIGERLGYFPEGGQPEGENGAQPEGDEPPAWAQGLIEEVNALKEERTAESQSREQQQLEQEATQWVDSELGKLREEHGESFTEEVEDHVCRLAASYTNEDGSLADDAIQKGFQDHLKITGQAQGALVDTKLNQPGAGIEPGGPDTSAPEFTDLNDEGLQQAVKARFAGAR